MVLVWWLGSATLSVRWQAGHKNRKAPISFERRKEKKERRSRERKEGKKDAVEREGKGVGGNLGKEE